MMNPMDELHPPTRLMLTPGPSCISPRVYRALATPLVGHVDPWFTEFMGGVQELLRRVFQTQNAIDLPDFRVRIGRHRNGRRECSGAGRRSDRLRERHVFRAHGRRRRPHRSKDSPRFRAVWAASGSPGRAPRRARPQNQVCGTGARGNFDRRRDEDRSFPPGRRRTRRAC